MDLSVAFDTVHHGLLLKRLRDRAGGDGPALDLIQSYLEGRQQRVCIKGKTSPPLPLTTGVPQGSVLGPPLFSLSVCNLTENFTDINVVQYADDSTLLIPVPQGDDPTIATKCYVQRFVDYRAANGIAAEPEKTQLLHIRATRHYAPRCTFEKFWSRLPGRWRATSSDFDVPNSTVGKDLIARFDAGSEYPITQDSDGDCTMLEWTASDIRGRALYWRDEGDSLIKWTKYVQQPAAVDSEESSSSTSDEDEDASNSDSESDSSDSTATADQTLQLLCALGGKEVQSKHQIKILGVLIDDQLSWKQHCQAAAAKM